MTVRMKTDQKRLEYYSRTDTWDQNGVNPPSEGTAYSYVQTSEYYNGEDDANYRRVIRARGNAQHELQAGRVQIRKLTKGHSEVTVEHFDPDFDGNPVLNSGSKAFASGHFVAPIGFLSPPFSDGTAEDIARAGFVSKARAAQTRIQGGVFLGEIRETIHAIRHPAQALRRGLDDYLKTVTKRSRGFKGKSSYGAARRMLGGTWLEYAFGWAPLVNDIKSAAEALAQLNGKFTPPEHVRASGRSEPPPTEYEDGTSNGGNYGSWTFRVQTKEKVTATMYGILAGKVVHDAPTFAGSFGFRARDFVPTVWELIPFSFVTDYFTNVGEILSAGCFSGDDFSWYGMSTICESTRTAIDFHEIPGTKPVGDGFSTRISGSSAPGSFEEKSKSLSRQRSGGLIPTLRFSVPGVRQAFNLAALFASSTKTSQEFARSLKIQ